MPMPRMLSFRVWLIKHHVFTAGVSLILQTHTAQHCCNVHRCSNVPSSASLALAYLLNPQSKPCRHSTSQVCHLNSHAKPSCNNPAWKPASWAQFTDWTHEASLAGPQLADVLLVNMQSQAIGGVGWYGQLMVKLDLDLMTRSASWSRVRNPWLTLCVMVLALICPSQGHTICPWHQSSQGHQSNSPISLDSHKNPKGNCLKCGKDKNILKIDDWKILIIEKSAHQFPPDRCRQKPY